MYSINNRFYIVSVASQNDVSAAAFSTFKCMLGSKAYYSKIFMHLNWIKDKTHDELCLTSVYFGIHANEFNIFLVLLLSTICIAGFTLFIPSIYTKFSNNDTLIDKKESIDEIYQIDKNFSNGVQKNGSKSNESSDTVVLSF